MIDYTVSVTHVRGSITDPAGAAVSKDCVAVFAADRATLLRTVEASKDGTFDVNGLKSGDYWLVIQDREPAFCPATARVNLRKSASKKDIAVHVQGAGIDRCSYCEAR